MLVVLVVLIVLIVLIVLVITNMLSHVHTLTSCGDDYLPIVGLVFGPTVGSNVLTCSRDCPMLSSASLSSRSLLR